MSSIIRVIGIPFRLVLIVAFVLAAEPCFMAIGLFTGKYYPITNEQLVDLWKFVLEGIDL